MKSCFEPPRRDPVQCFLTSIMYQYHDNYMEIRGVSKEKHHFLPFSCKVLLNFSLKSDVRSGVQRSLFAINVGLLGVVLHCGKHEGCKRRVLLDVV